jgi:ribosome-associated protein
MRRGGEEELQEGRGRSVKKRAARAVEELARQLVELPESELLKLRLTKTLLDEVEFARETRGHSSRKRQLKYLAGLLRRDQEQYEAISAALAGRSLDQRRATLAFHELEELRDRLCVAATFDAALSDVCARYPLIDTARLTRLAGAVHEHGDKKAAREIFRSLRKEVERGEDGWRP